MNILVKTYSGHIIFRPDTTWEKDNEDLYVPDFVERLSYTPVLFARICKPGRSVMCKFADRYYDAFNYGVLLYPENMIDGSEEGFACASCLDHTSFLPHPLYQKVVLGNDGNEVVLNLDDAEIWRTDEGNHEMICNAIEEVTSKIYIRTGDIVCIELDKRKPLVDKSVKEVRLHGSYCGNFLLDFKISMR